MKRKVSVELIDFSGLSPPFGQLRVITAPLSGQGLAWLYHVQLPVAVIHWHVQVCFQLRAHALEEVEDGHLDGPQLQGFLGSRVLDVGPASLLRREDTCSMGTCSSKEAASALETLAWRP